MNTKSLSEPRMRIAFPLAAGAAFLVAACGTVSTPAVADSMGKMSGGSMGHGDAHTGMKPRTHTTRLTFSSVPRLIIPGLLSTWTLRVTEAASGKPVHDFEVDMTKLMHLIVVRKDLTWFNHIHPVYRGNGTFVVTTRLPSAGRYKLYADFTRKSQGQEVPQHEFTAGTGRSGPAAARLVPGRTHNAWQVKQVRSHPEGQPDSQGGDAYEVAMMPMPAPVVAGQDTMLHFRVRTAAGRPIKDLEPYLGAMGHCVILSSDTSLYLHSHPMAGGVMKGMADMSLGGEMKMRSAAPQSNGPDVMFHTNFPRAGLYKAWGQFKHKGRIITAGFVLNVGKAPLRSVHR